MNSRPVHVSRITAAYLEQFVPMLATCPDSDVAIAAGVNKATIRRFRTSLGILPYTRENELDQWLHLVGIEPDRVIAALADVSVRVVSGYRRARGIEPQAKVREAARAAKARTGKKMPPRKDRGAWLPLLGKMSDADVAAKAGIHMATARQWRIDAGIGPFQPRRTPQPKTGREWLAVTRWAQAWDDANDRTFMATDYADDRRLSLPVAVARIERAVRRGEITEVDKHDPKRGVCGCYVVAE